MRPITLKIAAGAVEAIPMSGRYVRNGDSSPTITVQNEMSGEYAILAPGDAVQFADSYTRLLFSHEEATEQTISVNFGFGQILTARTVGTVEVIDGGYNRTLSHKAFAGHAGGGAVSGGIRACELHMPSGTGKRAVISQLTMSVTGNVLLTGYMAHEDFPVYPPPIGNDGPPGSGARGRSRYIDNTWESSDAYVRSNYELTQEVPGDPETYPMWMVYASSFGVVRHVFPEPIILDPGAAFRIVAGAANIGVYATFEWFEEDV
jgi:hypothetical protein